MEWRPVNELEDFEKSILDGFTAAICLSAHERLWHTSAANSRFEMPNSSGEPFKYWAFISYSHHDRKWGDWLHKALETYGYRRGSLDGKQGSEKFHRACSLFSGIERNCQSPPT